MEKCGEMKKETKINVRGSWSAPAGVTAESSNYIVRQSETRRAAWCMEYREKPPILWVLAYTIEVSSLFDDLVRAIGPVDASPHSHPTSCLPPVPLWSPARAAQDPPRARHVIRNIPSRCKRKYTVPTSFWPLFTTLDSVLKNFRVVPSHIS